MARPYLGHRVSVTVKLPQAYFDKLVAVSESEGLTRQDFMQKVMTAYLDAVPMPEVLVDGQMELPMAS